MNSFSSRSRFPFSFRVMACCVLVTFTAMLPVTPSQAQEMFALPTPGVRISVSPEFTPPLIKGITIHPENPLQFDFLMSRGKTKISGQEEEREYERLIKYFLAALTIPEKDLWVNLSPYEGKRVISPSFGKTEMGRDLLAQDYMLKQITASLIYPEDQLGKTFWDKIYKEARERFHTTEIPVNTFNKVWIVPDQAVVYEHGSSAFLIYSHLKVMLEEDYIALSQGIPATKDPSNSGNRGSGALGNRGVQDVNQLGSQIIREIVIPALEKEVNEGKNFALLRQIVHSMVLATWFKRTLKETLLSKVYVDQAKVKGVEQSDTADNEKIYNQYLEAYKKGVFNYIKEDVDQETKETIPRKYFSGGVVAPALIETVSSPSQIRPEARAGYEAMMADAELRKASVNLDETRDGDSAAMLSGLVEGERYSEYVRRINELNGSQEDLVSTTSKAFTVLPYDEWAQAMLDAFGSGDAAMMAAQVKEKVYLPLLLLAQQNDMPDELRSPAALLKFFFDNAPAGADGLLTIGEQVNKPVLNRIINVLEASGFDYRSVDIFNSVKVNVGSLERERDSGNKEVNRPFETAMLSHQARIEFKGKVDQSLALFGDSSNLFFAGIVTGMLEDQPDVFLNKFLEDINFVWNTSQGQGTVGQLLTQGRNREELSPETRMLSLENAFSAYGFLISGNNTIINGEQFIDSLRNMDAQKKMLLNWAPIAFYYLRQYARTHDKFVLDDLVKEFSSQSKKLFKDHYISGNEFDDLQRYYRSVPPISEDEVAVLLSRALGSIRQLFPVVSIDDNPSSSAMLSVSPKTKEVLEQFQGEIDNGLQELTMFFIKPFEGSNDEISTQLRSLADRVSIMENSPELEETVNLLRKAEKIQFNDEEPIDNDWEPFHEFFSLIQANQGNLLEDEVSFNALKEGFNVTSDALKTWSLLADTKAGFEINYDDASKTLTITNSESSRTNKVTNDDIEFLGDFVHEVGHFFPISPTFKDGLFKTAILAFVLESADREAENLASIEFFKHFDAAATIMLNLRELSRTKEVIQAQLRDVNADIDELKSHIEAMRSYLDSRKLLSDTVQDLKLAVDFIERAFGSELIFSDVTIFEVKSQVSNVLEKNRPDIQIVLDVQTDRYQFRGDKLRIIEVIRNLTRNAGEAMPEGGVLTVTISEEGEMLKIDFIDTGTGIPVEVQKRLFVESGVTTKGDKGNGRGLPRVKRIVEQHGGTIGFTSTEGKGTTFSVRLPFESKGDVAMLNGNVDPVSFGVAKGAAENWRLKQAEIARAEFAKPVGERKLGYLFIPSVFTRPDVERLKGRQAIYLDIGGSTYRAGLGRLDVADGKAGVEITSKDNPQSLNREFREDWTGQKKIEYFVDQMAQWIVRDNIQADSIGVSFSFAQKNDTVLQDAHGSKGWYWQDLVGQDLKQVMNEALKKKEQELGRTLPRVFAIANDSEATAALGGAGHINGTGANTFLWDKEGRGYNLESGPTDAGEFYKPEDRSAGSNELDGRVEAIMAGKHLGRLAFTRIRQAIPADALSTIGPAGQTLLSGEYTEGASLPSAYVTEIATQESLPDVQAKLSALEIFVPEESAQKIWDISRELLNRAAWLNAGQLWGQAQLFKQSGQTLDMVVDGAMWKVPGYQSLVQSIINGWEPGLMNLRYVDGATQKGAIILALQRQNTGTSGLVQNNASDAATLAEVSQKPVALAVDDEPSILRALTRILKSEGFEVVQAVNGQEALELVRRDPKKFQVVVSDNNMPLMTGPQMAQNLKDVNPDLPVVIQSGDALKLDELQAQGGKIVALLLKPWGSEELIKAIAPYQKAPLTPGGIDLNSANMNLQIKRDGSGVPLSLEFQDISNIHIDGLVPRILEITPINNLPVLMGLNDSPNPPVASVPNEMPILGLARKS